MADGQVLDCLNTLKKDNTGYHLKHLFIGSEGTLGVITKVAIQCPNTPKCVNVSFIGQLEFFSTYTHCFIYIIHLDVFIGLESFDKVLQFFSMIRKEFAGCLSSFELMDSIAIKSVKKNVGYKCPIIENLEFYVLVELSADNNFINLAIQEFLERALENEIILDATVADQPSQIQVINIIYFIKLINKYMFSKQWCKLFFFTRKDYTVTAHQDLVEFQIFINTSICL